jgi:hypothetical protein
MKALTPFLAVVILAGALATSVCAQQVNTEYDRFKDETTIKLEKTRVAGTGDDDALYVLVSATFRGTKPLAESAPMLSFFSASPSRHFEYDRELIFLIDGRRVRAGTMLLVDFKEGAEWIMAPLQIETLAQLARAKKIEGKVGDREFILTAKQIEALRAFLARITPS